MSLQRKQWNRSLALGLTGAAVWLSLAACSGTPAAAPQAPGAPGASDAYTVLSQNPRFAQASPADTPVAAGPKVMSPDEARSAAPFAFGLPAWVPPGFELQAQAEVISPSPIDDFASVSLTWQNAQGAAIELLISHGDASNDLAGAGGPGETLQIGGQPASLRQQTGFGRARLTLSWLSGSLTYRLTAESGAATRDELVQMAESIS